MKRLLNLSIILTIIIMGSGVACQSETSRKEQPLEKKVQNLETFARLYGYARWFHPSDEAQAIDWDKFAVLGVQKVENIQSSAELRDTLYSLFSPIVQGLQIYKADRPEKYNPDILLSPDPYAKPVAWQHHGVYLNKESNIYKSMRTNISDINKTSSAMVAKQTMNTSRLHDKEVKFSGYFRSDKGGAKLFIQLFTSLEPMEDYKTQEIIIESEEWKKYELTLTIPKETVGIIYGVEFDADYNGEVWADHFEFILNNGGVWESVDTVNMGFEFGKVEHEEKPIDGWRKLMMYHTAEITDENPYSGKYSMKVSCTGKMFDRMPQLGEVTKTPIGNNLICVVPLILQTNDSTTYPKTGITTLSQLQSELSEVSLSKYIFSLETNLASVIIAWNVLQHFFPYFDVIDTDWNHVLTETLESTLQNKHKKEFYITLSQMFAKLEDGHGVVFNGDMFSLPVRTEYIENKIVITASDDSSLRRGDIIHTIDGQPVMEAFEEKERMISGSPQLRRYRALNILGGRFGSAPKQLVIEQDGKEKSIMISNSKYGRLFFNPIDERPYLSETIVEIEPGIYYINMANCTDDEFEEKKNILACAKAVIYDQRGGNRLDFFQIIPYLIKEPVSTTWWDIPQTIYPDRKEVEFHTSNWNIHPKQPLFKSKSIIINVPSVVSAGETMIGIIDYYNLATTVGEPTAGCNGNINTIKMPCGYYAWFTGMRVLKHDGSQLYLNGFEPDYPVNKTIQAVKEGRDEYLEKALEVARQ